MRIVRAEIHLSIGLRFTLPTHRDLYNQLLLFMSLQSPAKTAAKSQQHLAKNHPFPASASIKRQRCLHHNPEPACPHPTCEQTLQIPKPIWSQTCPRGSTPHWVSQCQSFKKRTRPAREHRAEGFSISKVQVPSSGLGARGFARLWFRGASFSRSIPMKSTREHEQTATSFSLQHFGHTQVRDLFP